MHSLRDKNIVVTGGSGLLGRAFASEIRGAGGRCIIADLAVTTDLASDTLHLDITDEQQVRQTLALLNDHGIPLNGWVNNAYPRTQDWGAHLPDIPYGSWRENVDMHLNGYFNCSRLALEHMNKHDTKGSLVNIASIYGIVAPDFSVYEGTTMTMPAAYAAIKGGIITLTKYLSAYYGPQGIRVNCLSPGGVFDRQPESFVTRYEGKVPLRRMASPGEIAQPLTFLLSDAANYITGHNLVVDGGWTAI